MGIFLQTNIADFGMSERLVETLFHLGPEGFIVQKTAGCISHGSRCLEHGCQSAFLTCGFHEIGGMSANLVVGYRKIGVSAGNGLGEVAEIRGTTADSWFG